MDRTKPISNFLSFIAFFFLFSFYDVRCAADYTVDFSYNESTGRGPSKWGQLKPEWKTCSVGKLQSPIDIRDEDVKVLRCPLDLKLHYKPALASIASRGYDIQVTWTGDAGGICIHGVYYKLQSCHWHTPTEHARNGHRLDLELHLVHSSSCGAIAVIGILYKIGQPDPFLQELLPSIKSVTKEQKSLGYLDPNVVGFGNRDPYYRYYGSLTTPPCTEGVTWTVFQEVKMASTEQVNALKDGVDEGYEINARPLQPLNNRPLHLFKYSYLRFRIIETLEQNLVPK